MVDIKEIYNFIQEKKEVLIPDVAEKFNIPNSIAGKNMRYMRTIGMLDSKQVKTKRIYFATKCMPTKRLSLDELLQGEVNE